MTPYADEIKSPNFVRLLKQLNIWFGLQRVDSFSGMHEIPTVVNITQCVTHDTNLTLAGPPIQHSPVNLQFNLYDSELFPVKWTLRGMRNNVNKDVSYLGGGKFAFSPDGNAAYILSQDRMIIINRQTGQQNTIAMPPDFPALQMPTDIAYDTRRNIVSIISYAGEGFFYRFDTKTNRWLDYHSVRNIDAFSLAYDRQLDQYIAWTNNGELLFISAMGELKNKKEIASKLAGFKRIYGQSARYVHLIEIEPNGKDMAIVGFDGDKVVSVWYYSMDSDTALLTYKP